MCLQPEFCTRLARGVPDQTNFAQTDRRVQERTCLNRRSCSSEYAVEHTIDLNIISSVINHAALEHRRHARETELKLTKSQGVTGTHWRDGKTSYPTTSPQNFSFE
jgi:hypothetical protein